MYIKRIPLDKLSPYGYARRQDLMLTTKEENEIRKCIAMVEAIGCHTLLTETVNLLDQARNKLADFLENEPSSSEK